MKHRKRTRRYGFALTEVLCAMVVLCAALLGTLETITYALKVTTETRGRMADYSKAEEAGLLALARNDPDIALSDDVTRKATPLVAALEGGRTDSLAFRVLAWRAAPDGKSTSLTGSPIFITIMK